MDEGSHVSFPDPARVGRSPLGAAAWVRAPVLLASGGLVTILTLAVLVIFRVDPLALAPQTRVDVLAYRPPLDDLRLVSELSLLCGVAVTGGLTLWFAVRDEARLQIRPARGAFALAVVGCVGGFLVGRALLFPYVLDAAALWTETTVLNPYWVAEVGLFFPVAVGLGGATGPLLVGLARSGALSSRLGGRTRGFAVLGVLVFAAGWSPPDPATCVLFAAPSLLGLGGAVVWLEFGPTT